MSAVIWLSATIAIYFSSMQLYRRMRFALLNPVLITIAILIAILVVFRIDFDSYNSGGRFLRMLLEPSVVALGVPLYQRRRTIIRRLKSIATAILLGSVVGIVVAVAAALLMGAPTEIVRSLAPRSVTTPIAIGIAERTGGLPSLTAVIVVASGVFGAVVGPPLLRFVGVKGGTAFGLAMGASAHGIGTSQAVQEGPLEGAGAGLAIGLMGIATAILTPIILELFTLLGLK